MIPNYTKEVLLTGKIILMLILLTLIINQIHWHDYLVITEDGTVLTNKGLLSCIVEIRPIPFIASVLFLMGSILITTFRLRLLLLVQKIVLANVTLAKLLLLGEFFNHLLPGSMGGDAVIALYTVKRSGDMTGSLVSIFANRFAGLCILNILAIIALAGTFLAGMTNLPGMGLVVLSIAAVTVTIILLLTLSLSKKLYDSSEMDALIRRMPFSRQITIARKAIFRYRDARGIFIPVCIYSALSVFLPILSVYMLGIGFEVNLGWYHYLLYLPIILILAALPLTPGGLGILEGLFLFFFGGYETPEKILAMVLLFRVGGMICSVPGAVIFLFADKIARQEMSQRVKISG